MRARLHELMPDLEEEVEYMCKSIRASVTPDVLAKWFDDVEKTLCKKASEGSAIFGTIDLPRLSRLRCDAHELIEMQKGKGNGAEVLAKEFDLFCLRFVDHWRAHSDVKLTYSLNFADLLRSDGKRGLWLTFDWRPTEAESQRKKLKSEIDE
mgnify:CR=1 FL=1